MRKWGWRFWVGGYASREIVLLANWKAGGRRNDHGHQHLHHRHAGLQQRRRSSMIVEEEEEDNAKETDDDYDEKKELLDG